MESFAIYKDRFDEKTRSVYTERDTLMPLPKDAVVGRPQADGKIPVDVPDNAALDLRKALKNASVLSRQVHYLPPDQFEEKVLKSKVPVVVEVGADWCVPCRAEKPILNELATKMGKNLTVMEMDFDEVSKLKASGDKTAQDTYLQIIQAMTGIPAEQIQSGQKIHPSFPTHLLYRDGQLVSHLPTGIMVPTLLNKWLASGGIELPSPLTSLPDPNPTLPIHPQVSPPQPQAAPPTVKPPADPLHQAVGNVAQQLRQSQVVINTSDLSLSAPGGPRTPRQLA